MTARMAGTTLPLAAIYVRISTDPTIQLSTDDQIGMARRAATMRGYATPDDLIFIDNESRAFYERRPALQEMLARAAQGDVAAVFVWQFSRLFSGVEQQIKIFRHLRRHGVRLFDKDGVEENLPGTMNKLMSGIKGLLHEFEVEQVRERTRDTHKEKALGGKLIIRPFYGFCHSKAHEPRKKGRNKGLVTNNGCTSTEQGYHVHPGELPHLRNMFEWTRQGASLTEIVDRLNALGVRTKNGCAWQPTAVGDLLDNAFYKGDYVWGKRKKTWDGDSRTIEMTPEGEWSVSRSPLGELVPAELWEAVAAIRGGRKKVREKGRRKHPPRVLDRLVFCGYCGRRMYSRKQGNDKGGKERETWQYQCTGYNSSLYAKCPVSNGLSELKIFADLEAQTGQMTNRAGWAGSREIRVNVAMPHSVETELAQLASREQQITQKRTRTLELVQLDAIPIAEFLAARRQIDDEEQALRARREQLLAQRAEATDLAGDLARKFGVIWPKLRDGTPDSLDDRRLGAARFIERIEVRAGRALLILRQPEAVPPLQP